MAAGNPYDRRTRGERHGHDVMATAIHGVGPAGWYDHGGSPWHSEIERQDLAIQDLAALAGSAHVRGQRSATTRLEQEHREALHAARREAWNEGHAAGQVDGQRALLRAIDERHGQIVNNLIENAGAILKREKTTRRDLHEMLSRTVACLERLVHSHHEGFTDLPF